MKPVKIFSTAFAAATLALTVACNDDLGVKTYEDGMLHFKFLLDNQGQWKDNGASGPQTRLMAPVEMTSTVGFDAPLYLQCTERNSIETAPLTRGQRITGEAFDGDNNPNAVKCFGLYAVVDGQQVLATSSAELTATYTEISRDELTPGGDWQVKETTLNFSGDEGWPDGATGDFYGFAPFPGWDGAADASHPAGDAGHTRCILVDTDNPTQPTITFMMQPEEEYNKDILTAKKTGVSKDDKNAGVELEFEHILSALKFKLDDDDTDGNGTNDMKYTVGIGGTEYYLQVKSITVDGIYDQGSVGIGNTYSDNGSTRTSNWDVDDTSKGSCTATLNRSYYDVTGDADKLINTDEHCMMVLPQTTPTGAKLVITADLTTDAEGTSIAESDVTFEAKLEGKTWLPGYSYTYMISKDSRALSYTLTSIPDGGSNGGAFSFDKDGGSKDFDVTSYAEYSDGGVAGTEPAKWHVEYSTDGGSKWISGLPTGFSLQRKSDGAYVGSDNAIDGSTSAVTYTLTAPMRNEQSNTIKTLIKNDYSKYAGADGYYDLSLHNIGYSEAICSQTTERNTANCYVVQGYGKFKIPLVYGNGVKKGKNNPIAYAYTWSGNGHGVFTDHLDNSITNPWLTTQLATDPNGAKIVWQDESNVVRSKSVRVEGDYLYFEINQDDVQPANILLAATVDGVIAWSWHIWVTAFNDFSNTVELTKTISGTTYKMNLLKRDLGWRTPEVKYYDERTILFRVAQNDRMGKKVQHNVTQEAGAVSLGGSNIAYQSGRKDPFPIMRSKVASYTLSGGKITSITYTDEDLFSGRAEVIELTAANLKTAGTTIQNPNYLYSGSGGNWFAETELTGGTSSNQQQQFLCWDPEGNYNDGYKTTGSSLVARNFGSHIKTIYDPCPVGFMVPNSGIVQMLIDNISLFSPKTTMKDLDGVEVKSPLDYVSGVINGDTLNFYFTGARRTTLQNFNKYGYVYSAGVFQNGTSGVFLRVNNTSPYLEKTPNALNVNRAFAVRPIVDESAGVVESWGSVAAGTFHEGNTTTEVELTQHGSAWGIDDDLTSVSFTINGSATSKTLQEILDNANYKERRIFVKNIKVYFTYNGMRTLLQSMRPYYINYDGKERKGSGAYIAISSIPDHYQFSANWDRRYPGEESVSTTTDWQSLVPLTWSTVHITKVTADLRITYFEE